MTRGDRIRETDDENLAVLFMEMLAERDRRTMETLRAQGVIVDLIEMPGISLRNHMDYLRQEINPGE